MSFEPVTPREFILRGEVVELPGPGKSRPNCLIPDRVSLLEIPPRVK